MKSLKNNKRVIIENTEYSILLYCLLKKNWEKDIYILSDLFREEFLVNFKKKIENVFVFKPTSIKKNIIKYYITKIILYLYIVKKTFNKEIEFYGNDNLVYSIFRNKGYFLLEDGIINYQLIEKNNEIIKKIIKLQNPFYKSYGYSKKVKKIYLTGLAEIPIKIKNKVEVVNLKELWEKKNKNEKKEILEIFGIDNKISSYMQNKNIILYTQPLSEDGIISEKEKIELYSKIILKYPKNKLILKIHPRERTKYEDIFEGVEILKKNFPAEFFDLLGVKFQKGVTIFSTAVLNSNIKEVDFYGTEIHPKLLKKFGSMDDIMKRNAFL
ncbi:glycosyltransferase family 52 [Fusobacterium sp. SYSU M8A802]